MSNVSLPAYQIVRDDLNGPEIAALLADHLANMAGQSPEESRHALDLTGLKQPDVFFYSLWCDDQLAGCGALKLLDAEHAEVKSMKTAAGFLRRGVAQRVLSHLLAEARALKIQCLSLETGSMAYFSPAHALYEKNGFTPCPPFANYQEDPHSRFYTRLL